MKSYLVTLANQSDRPEVRSCVEDEAALDLLARQLLATNELLFTSHLMACSPENHQNVDALKNEERSVARNKSQENVRFIANKTLARSADITAKVEEYTRSTSKTYNPRKMALMGATHFATNALDLTGRASEEENVKCAAAIGGLALTVVSGVAACKVTLGFGCALYAASFVNDGFQAYGSCRHLFPSE